MEEEACVAVGGPRLVGPTFETYLVLQFAANRREILLVKGLPFD